MAPARAIAELSEGRAAPADRTFSTCEPYFSRRRCRIRPLPSRKRSHHSVRLRRVGRTIPAGTRLLVHRAVRVGDCEGTHIKAAEVQHRQGPPSRKVQHMAKSAKTAKIAKTGTADKKPNILVIWGDDIGITNLSC